MVNGVVKKIKKGNKKWCMIHTNSNLRKEKMTKKNTQDPRTTICL